MSHTVNIDLTADQDIYLFNQPVNIHDIAMIELSDDGMVAACTLRSGNKMVPEGPGGVSMPPGLKELLSGSKWEKGKCAWWHKPCREARGDCNMYQEIPVMYAGPLNVPRKTTIKICLLWAMYEMLKTPIMMPVQVGPGAKQV